MKIELTNYSVNIFGREIHISDNENKKPLNMILFTDYDYSILNIGFGLGYLDKTILKAEYCKVGENEFYDITISLTMKDYMYIDIEGINMDNNEIEPIINIKDKIISINNEI
jgi:uncharacterized protein YneR